VAEAMSGPDDPGAAPVPTREPIEGAFFRYKVLAFAVGTGLMVLVFIGVPLQLAAGLPQVGEIVGPIHGFLYIVYLLASLDLVRRARFPLWQMALMVGAGFVPGLAFVIEHFVARWVTQVVAARRIAEGQMPPEPQPGTGEPATPVVTVQPSLPPAD
jgi:integral membrane protein